jgi:hypothetical protein
VVVFIAYAIGIMGHDLGTRIGTIGLSELEMA